MSAYGGFFIRFSDDIEVDAKKITSQLNKYHGWCEEPGKWVMKHPDEKCLSPFYWKHADGYASEVCFPSLNVYRISRREDQIFVGLKELSDKVAQHVKQGHFEIVCSSNDQMIYLTFEKLIIKSDGFVQLTRIGSCSWDSACDMKVDSYSPPKTSI